jgi:hypothetical protein
MKKLLLLLLLIAPTAQARVDHLSLELKRMPFQRSYFFPGQTDWGHEVSLLYKVSILKGHVWMDSDITGQTMNGRFRRTYWDYTLGVKLIDEVDLVWDHVSDHHIDWEMDKFQVRDSWGIRINFKR